MHDLADTHEIYSNIGADPLALQVVDAWSGRVIAQTGQMRSKGETFLLGGRLLEVIWRDRYRLGVRPATGQPAEETLRFVTAPFAVPLDISQAVAAHLGVAPGQMALVHDEAGTLLFHFWGDLYGALLAAMLEAELAPDDGAMVMTVLSVVWFALWWTVCLHGVPGLARRQLRRWMPQIQTSWSWGPCAAAETHLAALAQCDLARFEGNCTGRRPWSARRRGGRAVVDGFDGNSQAVLLLHLAIRTT